MTMLASHAILGLLCRRMRHAARARAIVLAAFAALVIAGRASADYVLHSVSFAPGAVTDNGSILSVGQAIIGVAANDQQAVQIGIIPCLGFALDLPEPPVLGDFNGDGHVTGLDLATLLGDWGPCIMPGSWGCPADLNGSGTVDGIDLAILLGNWG